MNVKRAMRSIDQAEDAKHSSTHPSPAGPTPLNLVAIHPCPTSRFLPAWPYCLRLGPDHLRRRAEALIRTLSDEDAGADRATKSSLELIVDGYAHVLALDVDRIRLEREIARLAESGDPALAAELRELSMVLRCVTRTSERLRDLLSAVRARVELGR